MKKLIISAAILLTVATAAFAKKTDNDKALAILKHAYPTASNISWQMLDNEYSVATFVTNGITMKAIYNDAGELVATSRPVTLKELPAGTLNKINEKYMDYTIKEAIEYNSVNMDQDTYFYVSVENDKKRVLLQITKEGNVSEFKVTRK